MKRYIHIIEPVTFSVMYRLVGLMAYDTFTVGGLEWCGIKDSLLVV